MPRGVYDRKKKKPIDIRLKVKPKTKVKAKKTIPLGAFQRFLRDTPVGFDAHQMLNRLIYCLSHHLPAEEYNKFLKLLHESGKYQGTINKRMVEAEDAVRAYRVILKTEVNADHSEDY